MPDYRGGNAGISQFGAQSADMLRKGQTIGQADRDFKERAALGIGQAAIVGLAGGIKKDQADRRDARKEYNDWRNNTMVAQGQSDIINKAIANATAKAHAGSGAGNGYMPGDSMGGHSGMVGGAMASGSPEDYIKQLGKEGLDTDAANAEASAAPVTWGGKPQYTPSGLDAATANAQANGTDEYNAQNIIRSAANGGFSPGGGGSSLSDRNDDGSIAGFEPGGGGSSLSRRNNDGSIMTGMGQSKVRR